MAVELQSLASNPMNGTATADDVSKGEVRAEMVILLHEIAVLLESLGTNEEQNAVWSTVCLQCERSFTIDRATGWSHCEGCEVVSRLEQSEMNDRAAARLKAKQEAKTAKAAKTLVPVAVLPPPASSSSGLGEIQKRDSSTKLVTVWCTRPSCRKGRKIPADARAQLVREHRRFTCSLNSWDVKRNTCAARAESGCAATSRHKTDDDEEEEEEVEEEEEEEEEGKEGEEGSGKAKLMDLVDRMEPLDPPLAAAHAPDITPPAVRNSGPATPPLAPAAPAPLVAASSPEDLARERLQPLGSGDRQRVDQLLSDKTGRPEDVLVDYEGCLLTREQLRRLRPRAVLSDENINIRMIQLQRRADDLPVNTLFLNTHFMSSLLNCDDAGKPRGYKFSNVERWHGPKKNDKKKIFAYDSVFIPVNVLNYHWTAIVVDVRECLIHHYDSLGGRDEGRVRAVEQWLKEVYVRDAIVVDVDMTWTHIYHEGNVPQQRNGFDCGVFVCTLADFLLHDLPLSYSQADMTSLRQKLVLAEHDERSFF